MKVAFLLRRGEFYRIHKGHKYFNPVQVALYGVILCIYLSTFLSASSETGKSKSFKKYIKINKTSRNAHVSARLTLVRVKGFEPPASWSQTTRATNCATPGN